MLNNRFSKCKTLKDLYDVFNNEDVFDYDNLSIEELSIVADVFEANLPDNVDMPERFVTRDGHEIISKAGYTLIWDVTIDTIDMEENKMLNNGTGNLINETQNDINDAMKKFNDNTGHGKKKGKTVEEADKYLANIQAALAKVLNFIDETLGFSPVKDAITGIIEAGLDGKSTPTAIKKMAEDCEKRIIEEAEFLMEFAADDVTFRNAIQLKALVEDGRRKSIFESFACGILWIADRMFDKLKSWYDNFKDKKGLLASIFRGIVGFIGIVSKGAKIVINCITKAVSYIIAGTIFAVCTIVNAIKGFVSKLKDWEIKAEEPDDTEDELEEEESDGVFGTNLA
jgi:hypothetical protein